MFVFRGINKHVCHLCRIRVNRARARFRSSSVRAIAFGFEKHCFISVSLQFRSLKALVMALVMALEMVYYMTKQYIVKTPSTRKGLSAHSSSTSWMQDVVLRRFRTLTIYFD